MPKNLIGIDIGSKLTKVMEANPKKGGLQILALDSFDTPYEGQEIDAKEFFRQLYSRIPQVKIKSSPIALAIPSSAINFTIIQVPKMPKEDLDKVVLREAKRKILPTPGAEDIFDYFILKETKVKEGIQLDILVGAGSKVVIDKHLLLFKQEELTPVFVISTPNALMRYFWEYKLSAERSWALIDVGFRNTSVVIFRRNDIALIRNIPFACFDFIQAIAKKTALGFHKAEEIFLREQYVLDEPALTSWQYLLSEIRRSFAYYKEITAGEGIDGIVFSGGMFRLPSSSEFIRKNMGGQLEFFSLSSLKNVEVKNASLEQLKHIESMFATTFGLALDFAPTEQAALNFVPAEIRRERRIKRIKLFSVQALSISAAVLIFFVVSLGVRLGVLRSQILTLNKNFSEIEYQDTTNKADKINKRLANIRRQKDIADKVLKQRVSWGRLFDAVSSSIPGDIFIKELALDDEYSAKNGIKVKIRGGLTGDYEVAKREIDRFTARLTASGFFKEVALEPLKLEEINVKEHKDLAALTSTIDREFSLEAVIKDEKDNR